MPLYGQGRTLPTLPLGATFSRRQDEELFEAVFGVPVSHRGDVQVWTTGSSIVRPGWEAFFNMFPDHLDWLIVEVTEPLVFGFEPRCPVRYTSAQGFVFHYIHLAARRFGPRVYPRPPHPYGAIGDGRPHPRTGSASYPSSPEEEVGSSSTPQSLQELVATSIPDTLEEQVSDSSSSYDEVSDSDSAFMFIFYLALYTLRDHFHPRLTSSQIVNHAVAHTSLNGSVQERNG